MASAIPAAAALSPEDVGVLLGGPRDARLLPELHLVAPQEDGTPLWRSLVYVVRQRTGGFMAVLPLRPEVEEFLIGDHALVTPLEVHHAQIMLETVRRRPVGETTALLLDVPWESLGLFCKASTLRGAAAQRLIRFASDGTACRPVRDSVEAAADEWIAEQRTDENAEEYATAEELDGQELDARDQELVDARETIHSLQEALSQAQQAAASTAPRPAAAGLLGAAPLQAPTPATMEKLRMMAGQAPRASQHEKALPKASRPPLEAGEMLQQEASLEAIDEEDVVGAGLELHQLHDPMQKLLLLQMQQMSLLQKQLAKSQPADAIHAALSGSGGSGESSSGIKGCLAREAYLKIAENLMTFCAVAEANAVQELGLTASQVGPGLMKDYLEKKIPLGNFRLLTQFGYMMASAWEVGHRTDNKELQGFAAKGLIFVEQSALDEGRTGLSWLLTGLPEPNFAMIQMNRQRSGLQPFSRLAKPSWIAANVGYLKDLDFLEGRIKATDRTKPQGSKEDKPQAAPKPKANFPPRKNQKGKKGEDSGAPSTDQD